ncbi:MAG: hypothetical protein C0503_08905, partial [Gemmatimonas sp.]|nr:hypothetical protein [Gemmatimonas sp.]
MTIIRTTSTATRVATVLGAAALLVAPALRTIDAQQIRTTPPTARATQAPVAGALAALGSPPNPKVAVSWDRFYDHAGLHEIGRRLAAAHPGFIKLGSIGKSTEGRD